jgi:hypothetical protein
VSVSCLEVEKEMMGWGLKVSMRDEGVGGRGHGVLVEVLIQLSNMGRGIA